MPGPGLRRSDKRIRSPARLSQMRRAYEEAWPTFKSIQIWANVTPALAAELDAERSLYAIRTSKSELVRQLIEEAALQRSTASDAGSANRRPLRCAPWSYGRKLVRA
jgi:hypothetical protein